MNTQTVGFKKALEMIEIIGDAIRELGSVPSGHLFVRVQPYLDIQSYQNILTLLEGAGKIRIKNHLITWIGK